MKIGVNLINFGPGVTPRVAGPLDRAGRVARLSLLGLGADYVLLDTYADDPEATRQPEVAWRMLTTLAERILDLPRETLR